jgi:hypothetical protein
VVLPDSQDKTLALMTVMDEIFMGPPWHGCQLIARHLSRTDH